jgi:transcriptional regulator with XRE-family HTH domain
MSDTTTDRGNGTDRDNRTERHIADRQRQLGARLRRIRHQQGMSLADVQERSGGVWKAVVVGAYERGDRTISVARLQQLAEFYRVPLADLLPPPASQRRTDQPPRYVLDLIALRHATTTDGRELLPVARFAARIRRHRGDHNGRVLTVRASDLEMLAFTTGQDLDTLVQRLRAYGVLRSSA